MMRFYKVPIYIKWIKKTSTIMLLKEPTEQRARIPLITIIIIVIICAA